MSLPGSNAAEREKSPTPVLAGARVNRYLLPRQDFEPAYRRAFRTGELQARARAAVASLRACQVCPRRCGVNRLADQIGACGIGRHARVAAAFAHLGEEDCLRGRRGSGTIFLSGCNLRCVFCQNHDISQGRAGREADASTLAGLMLELQAAGCHNINWVTPEHVVPQLLEALVLAVPAGLRLPLVYNTSAYDSPETLRLLEGVVDIYLPDFKLWNPDLCARLLGARDYPEVARAALLCMHTQVGVLHLDESGLALRGVLVRHLVLPGWASETRAILRWLAAHLGRDLSLNLMDQYRPAHRVAAEPGWSPLDRPLRRAEFARALAEARRLGLRRLEGVSD